MFKFNKNLLYLLNFALLALSLIFLLLAVGYTVTKSTEIPYSEEVTAPSPLPKTLFEKDRDEYDQIGPPFLSLEYTPISLRIPDLRRQLLYFGTNERPDSEKERSTLYFSFTGSKEVVSAEPSEPIYFTYANGKYAFSEENVPTSLWFQAVPTDDLVKVSVTMQDDEGNLLTSPKEYAQFTLKSLKRPKPTARKSWEIGKWRVDGTLLARQRAKWYGRDQFLEQHGGEEYAEFLGKERIDFEDENHRSYSVYLSPETVLVWKDERWHEVIPGKESVGLPLIQLKKIDGRLMRLQIWSENGERVTPLNMIKAAEPWNPKNEEKSFQFAGARSANQFQIKVDGKRLTLHPGDWLLKQEDRWIKLNTLQAIDDYVDRRVVGTLFVFEGPSESEEGQILRGTLFSPSRALMSTVEIPIQQKLSTPTVLPEENDFFEDEDDEDEDYD